MQKQQQKAAWREQSDFFLRRKENPYRLPMVDQSPMEQIGDSKYTTSHLLAMHLSLADYHHHHHHPALPFLSIQQDSIVLVREPAISGLVWFAMHVRADA